IEYLNGKRLSECLEKESWAKIGKEIGKKIKQIHDKGIIHGDLTTSNLILKKSPMSKANVEIFFIDFGLSFFSEKTEDKAVDLHVLEEALESKHYTISKKMFAAVKKAYNDPIILKRLQEVEGRGRNKKITP
ncbi:MAG: lipopolysaccharide kinase InaA family protein, partial [Nanoarchaeota archaeon]